jgi:2-oxoglutarate ferredoxin oxidoreductase subunit alpha
VNGKNLFPSNIYGLPTWYYIRVNKDGYRAHRTQAEVLITYNFDTFAEDIAALPSGGVCIYPLDAPNGRRKWNVVTPSRDDLYYYRIPVDELTAQVNPPQAMKEYVANMAYVGAAAYLFNIDMAEIERALSYHFGGKAKPIEMNYGLVKLAYQWCEENLQKIDPYWCEQMDETHYNDDLILIEGNAAAALGAVFGGVQFIAWYPITPSSSLAENLQVYLATYRRDTDGKATYAVIQAEDELAAIGMTVGAGWTGARSMTCTSGPGVSLMAEFAGLAYFAEVPAVIWDVQRIGPSTGLPTRTSQGDVMFIHFMGHGDTRQVCLFPANMEECFKFGWQAFDFAERLQTPVFVLSDLDLGMNQHTSKKFDYPDRPMDRGKVLSAEELERLGGNWARYKDVDGDGIPYRTLPGTNHPSAGYFTRGTGHNEYANYSERTEDWHANLIRLGRKMETARELLPQPVVQTQDGAKIAIVSYGSNELAIKEVIDLLAAEDIPVDYLRIRALPLSPHVGEFVRRYERLYVIENNQEGQMASILRMEIPDKAGDMRSIARCNGLPLDAEWIRTTLLEMEGK